MIAAALVGGAGLATWQALRATRAEQVAEERLVEVEAARAEAQLRLDEVNRANELLSTIRGELLKTNSEFIAEEVLTLNGRQVPTRRYKITGEIGRGAMGAVLRGLDPALDREVAVKIISHRRTEGGTSDEELTARFIREAKLAARINHPGVVTIHDAGEGPLPDGDVALRRGAAGDPGQARRDTQGGDGGGEGIGRPSILSQIHRMRAL